MIDPILREKFKEFMSDDPFSADKANVLYFINMLDHDWSESRYRMVLESVKDDPLFKKELNRLKIKHGEMTPDPKPVFTKEYNTNPIVTKATKWDCIKLMIKNKIKKLLGEQ